MDDNLELVYKYGREHPVIIGNANSKEYSIGPATRLEDFMEEIKQLYLKRVSFNYDGTKNQVTIEKSAFEKYIKDVLSKSQSGREYI